MLRASTVLALLCGVHVTSALPHRPLWQNDGADDPDAPLWQRKLRTWEEPDDEDERYLRASRGRDGQRRPWRQLRLATLLALAWWSRRQLTRRPGPAAVGFALAGGLALYLSRRAVGGAPGLVVTLLTDVIGAAVNVLSESRR